MAQKTSSSSRGSTRSRPRSSRSTRSNSSSRASASSKRRTSSNGAKASSSRRATKSASTARSSASRGRSSANGAVAQVGEKVSGVAAKAKTPLIAAGAAVAGIAGGIALRSRNNQKSPMKRLRAPSMPSMPKALKNADLSKIDLDKLTSAAHKVRSIGEQVGDVADAAEKTRKKHK